MQKKMNYNHDKKNNSEYHKKLNNEGFLDINSSQEEMNSDIFTKKKGDEGEKLGTGKFRFINTQAEKEKKNKKQKNSKKNETNYINNKNEKIENNNNLKNTKNLNEEKLNKKFNNHKKIKSYESNNSKSKEEIDNYNNYPYIETDSNENENVEKQKLNKQLKRINQKNEKLKGFEQAFLTKNHSLQNKNLINNKNYSRNATFESDFHGKKNYLKEENATYPREYYPIGYNSNSYLRNYYLKPKPPIIRNISLLKMARNKYYDEEDIIYRSMMSPDINRLKKNVSFNKSIEQKRKLLGIPLYKDEFKKYYTTRKENISKEEKEDLNKLMIYKKRQDEILRNYEKKNIINHKRRFYIKNKTNPIRIRFKYHKNKKYTNPYNIFANNNYINNEAKNKNHLRLNNSYIAKRPDFNKFRKVYFNNQREIDNHNRQNVTQNSVHFNDRDKNYLKHKVYFYKLKEKEKNNSFISKEQIRDSRNSNELKELSHLPYNTIDLQIDKIATEKESQKNSDNWPSNNNSNNKVMNTLRSTKYNKRNINLKLSNAKDVSPKTKIIYSSPRYDEIMSIEENNGKTMHIVQKRHKLPNIILLQMQANKKYQKRVLKKPIQYNRNIDYYQEYTNNRKNPGRGLSALRRINQRIENYKKGAPSMNEQSLKEKINNISLY